MYVNDIQHGTTACKGNPLVVKETAATAFVDGNNLLGPVCVILETLRYPYFGVRVRVGHHVFPYFPMFIHS